jgi:hypothetical protein
MLAPALGFAKGGLGAAIIGGAAGGFVGGFSGTMLYGGSLSQALKAGFRGALISGISAGLTHGIGGALGHQVPFGSGNHVKKIIAHGAVGGLRSVAQGGKFEHGFMSGAVTATFAPGINHIKGQGYRVAAAALVGGTAAELGGGKFANGAITGAFVQMFNDEVKGYLHKRINLKGGWRALTEEGGVYEFKDIEGFFSVEAADAAMHADKVMGRIWMIPIEAVKYALVGWPAIIVDIGVTKFDLWEAFVPYDYIHPGHIRVRTTVLEGNSLYDNHIGLIHNETRNYKPGDSGYEYYRGLLLH